MYSSEDLERFYLEYQSEWVPRGMTLQAYCSLNNVQRMFRHIAMGRRIWMHVGSHDAAENISFIYSILKSCKLNDISFGDYIEDVCTRIMHGDSDYESMLPCDYKPQKQDATTQAVV